MAPNYLVQPVAAAVTSKVKLCPYDEEEPHIWLPLIEAQFTVAGIKLQKLNYVNALPRLPKQVLRDIFDTLDVCNNLDHPFDLLEEVLLGQFGMSKCQSYIELLRLHMDKQGLKPSILMGNLKQHLPPGVFPDTDLFLAMFLIRLPPSMREAVGAGNHKTAADMVRAADALWDARDGHDPMVTAATGRKTSDKRNGNARSKSHPPFRPAFHTFQNPQWRVQVSQLLLQ
jgi:hypothetical protein